MTDRQPEALRLAELLELAPEDGIEPQTAEDAAAGLRRLHAENESLQAGYAAARLEIESLQARIKTMEQRAGVDVLAWGKGGCRPATSPEIAMWHSLAAAPTTQPLPALQGDALEVTHKGRCQHCIDRHDGIYGSWAAPCPYHDDDGNPRIDAARAAQEGKSHG